MIALDTVYHLPALDLLRSIDDESVDCAIIDPPYGINYKSGWKEAWANRPRVTRSSFGNDIIDLGWIAELPRVLKASAALYLFTRWDVLHIWKEAIETAGLIVKQRIVWDKGHWGFGNLDYFGSQTEDILFCTKTDHHLRWSKRQGNVWRLAKLSSLHNEGNYDNPTQKPERLLMRMIHLSSYPGDVILDPFCGSGSVGAAARRLNRHYIIGDIDEYQYSVAKKRLEESFTADMFSQKED